MSHHQWKLSPEEMDARQRAIREAILNGPRKSVPSPFDVLLASPDTAEHAQQLGAFLRYRSELPRVLFELAVLVTARSWDAGYEWSIHAPLAERAGVPASAIEAISRGAVPEFPDPDMVLIYRFAATFHRERQMPRDLAEEARARFGAKAVVELTAILGYYAFLAMQIILADIRTSPWPFPDTVRSTD